MKWIFRELIFANFKQWPVVPKLKCRTFESTWPTHDKFKPLTTSVLHKLGLNQL